jgi:hypothetical protein
MQGKRENARETRKGATHVTPHHIDPQVGWSFLISGGFSFPSFLVPTMLLIYVLSLSARLVIHLVKFIKLFTSINYSDL